MARKTAQQRRIEALLQSQTAEIKKSFLAAIAQASGAIDRRGLIRLLERGDIERAVALFRIDSGVLFPLHMAIQGALIGGGLSVAADLPVGISGSFGFDGSHSRAIALAQGRAGELITSISDDAVLSARAIIIDGLESNRSVNSVARDLVGRKVGDRRVGGVIGLTEQQTDRMINLRSLLQDPERISEYFKGSTPRYAESNRRFDAMVRKAANAGKALSAADADRVVEAYRSKAGLARSKRVARTEAFMAQSAGRHEAYTQLNEGDKFESVTIRWQKSPRVNDREEHLEVDGTIIKVGELFTQPDGVQMKYPHDPAGGAKHNVNCGCIGIYRVNLLRPR